MTRPDSKHFNEPRSGKPFVLVLDNSVANQDWLKGSTWDGPTTLDGLLKVLGVAPDATLTAKRRAIRKFSRLPAYQRLPAGIKTALVKQGIL